MLVLFALGGGEAYILYKNIFHIMGTTKPLWVPEMEIKKMRKVVNENRIDIVGLKITQITQKNKQTPR